MINSTHSRFRVAGGFAVAVVVAALANLAISAAARAAGASEAFAALQPPAIVWWTVVGVVGSFVGWAFVRSRSHRPAQVLRVLVPSLLVVSFIPDIVVGVTGRVEGSSWGSVVALMGMHVVVAACAVTVLPRVLPVDQVARPS